MSLHTATREALSDAVKEALGRAADVESIVHIGGGAHNDCYRVDIGLDESYFLKVEKDGVMPKTRSGQVRREAEAIRVLNGLGIPCPKLVYHDADGSRTGLRCLLTEFVDAPLVGEIWEDAGDAARRLMKDQIGSVLQKLLAHTSSAFGETSPGGAIGQHASWREAWRSMADILLTDSANLELYGDADLKVIEQAFALAEHKLVSNGPASFLHMDLHPFNVLADTSTQPYRVRALIDFGFSLYGPGYILDDAVRKFGGWGLEVRDTVGVYGISQDELQASQLVFDFDLAVFLGSIKFRPDHPYGCKARLAGLLDDCRKIIQRG